MKGGSNVLVIISIRRIGLVERVLRYELRLLSMLRFPEILRQPSAPDAKVLDLLNTYRAEQYANLWQQDPRLYHHFSRKLISPGHPTRAFELAREGLIYHPEDLQLKYLSALALARGGNTWCTMQPARISWATSSCLSL